MTQCPDHPGVMSANITDCTACRREVVPPTPEFLAAKAAIPRRQVTHRHPTPPATDVRAAREAIDTKEQTNG